MNLLNNEPWIPVRRRDGSREWIAPSRFSDPEIVAFDADRPDFNGALAQFAIGLLQTTTPADSASQWRKLLATPPNAANLAEWFAPVLKDFEFDGAGARFMQDFTLKADDGTVNDIGALLIEMPGENALKNNSDHFVKRGQAAALCPACAATALLTLQLNAPSGGVGHRTGLRGGGPLTTLLVGQPPGGLWRDLWLNVQERSVFLASCGDAGKVGEHLRFPWLADMSAIQKERDETAPAQVHPDHLFWAMPRRVRLDLDALASGQCGICARESDRLVRQYVTKNYGFNYKGAWNHPLSPYYEAKDGELPLHPQPGGLGYRHWLAWVLGQTSDKKKQRAARIVSHALDFRQRQLGGGLRLWAFGYDMDNMKARCWYESIVPLYDLAECASGALGRIRDEVGLWLASADLAASYLRGAVKDAWFSADARGDFSAVDAAFWSRTEDAFYRQLQALIDREKQAIEWDTLPARQAWHQVLLRTAERLFDGEFVGAGQVERQNPRRIAEAHTQLNRNMRGPKLCGALGLPVPEKKTAKATKRAA